MHCQNNIMPYNCSQNILSPNALVRFTKLKLICIKMIGILHVIKHFDCFSFKIAELKHLKIYMSMKLVC